MRVSCSQRNQSGGVVTPSVMSRSALQVCFDFVLSPVPSFFVAFLLLLPSDGGGSSSAIGGEVCTGGVAAALAAALGVITDAAFPHPFFLRDGRVGAAFGALATRDAASPWSSLSFI